jgi:hypothetical protein
MTRSESRRLTVAKLEMPMTVNLTPGEMQQLTRLAARDQGTDNPKVSRYVRERIIRPVLIGTKQAK